MTLNKKNPLYSRDENGQLIPIEVKLEIDENIDEYDMYKDETVKVIPMSRGKVKRLFASNDTDKDDKDLDGELIFEHCTDPKYTKEEILHLRPALATAIVNTILRESGLGIGKSKKKSLQEAEDDFAKN